MARDLTRLIGVLAAAFSFVAASDTRAEVGVSPGRLDQERSVFVTPLDNPLFLADVLIEDTVATESAARQAGGSTPFDVWGFNRFGLHGQWRCAADDALCVNVESRGSAPALNVWPALSGTWEVDATMPIEVRGAQLGLLPVHFSMIKSYGDLSTAVVSEYDVEIDPETIVVPVNSIVVVPAGSISDGGPRNSVNLSGLLDPQIHRLLFDDDWGPGLQRFTHPGGELTAEQGQWRMGTQSSSDGATFPAIFPAISSVPFTQPDAIFAQCGVQFRLASITVIEEDDPIRIWATTDGTPTGAGLCAGMGLNDTVIAGWFRTWSERAAAATPRVGTYVPFGIDVLWTHKLSGLGCLQLAAGLTDFNIVGSRVAISLTDTASAPNPRLVLAHELGHALGLEHPDDLDTEQCTDEVPAGNQHQLMCKRGGRQNTHILGCDVRDGEALPSAPYNCSPAEEDVRAIASCDTVRKSARGISAAFFKNLGLEPPVVDAGEDLSVECDSNEAATITLSGTATSGSILPLAVTEWREDGIRIGSGLEVETEAPLGTTEFTLVARDRAGLEATDAMEVTVVDTTPPVLDLPPTLSVSVCSSQPSPVDVPFAIASDACSPGSESISGQIVAINEAELAEPIALGDGPVQLVPGRVLVLWTAQDDAGNQATFEQVVLVETRITEDCCETGQQLIVGTEARDRIAPTVVASYCILSLGGDDSVKTPSSSLALSDLIAGGEGRDVLDSGNASSVIFGGPGNDVLRAESASYFLAGETGDDLLVAPKQGTGSLAGGEGDDHLVGSHLSDEITPGPGGDTIIAGPGDDIVILYDICEVSSAKVVIGGQGFDTLIAPVGLDELRAAGMVINGIEEVVIDTSRRHLSPCFGGSP